MRSIVISCLVAVFYSTAIAQSASSAKLAELGWLSGCWEMKNRERGTLITEMWMKAEGDAMLGVGRTLKAGKLVDFEFLRIVEDVNGLSYISRPSANKEDTAFRMIKISTSEIVFQNLTHDFPQRIIYKREGEKLKARIEASQDGKTRGVDFFYTRVLCN
jgi:hypothetical protein